ncbi:glycosyltransferase family 2 protein [Paenibacillus agricola]|uniref:Glycosyltransferase n=1 Tax=Paenibacillus agricola TaxID=2716264 RepID=A0ABX0JCU0_9BACL|nr:glycosyltransferase family 2 protein [Paenibacillus agricola]NHN34280.1 glycosyltransferase [Paenibacillus agricola]
MKVSIITICYNSEDTIKDTINSILEQTYANIEYILVDGNSKDNTLSIIKDYEIKFNGRLKWSSEPDKGLYDAMNKGLKVATGEIVGFINSDDFLIDKFVIEDVVNNIIESNADLLYANLYYVQWDNPQNVIRKWITKKIEFRLGWTPPFPTLFIKKNFYDQFQFNIKYKYSADYEFQYRLFEIEKIKSTYLNRFTVRMRVGGVSTNNFKNIWESYKETQDILKEFGEKNTFWLVIRRLFVRLLNN